MTSSTFTSTTSRINDLRRVEESLSMIAPRWSVRILHTLRQDTPLRFTEVKLRLPQMQDPSLSQRLAALADHGLIDRTAVGGRPVYYELTDRGRDLAPVHDALAAWAAACLEDTGPATKAEHAEDALKLISPRHATAVLWALRQSGPLRSGELSREVTPGMSPMVMTSRLRQLGADGLVERVTDSHRSPYQLTAAAHALGPVYAALSAWAAGRPPTTRSGHRRTPHSSALRPRHHGLVGSGRDSGPWLRRPRPPARAPPPSPVPRPHRRARRPLSVPSRSPPHGGRQTSSPTPPETPPVNQPLTTSGRSR
ncbi:winged helix-turn-helix transcriptional regulator [Streptomyces sp. NPDC001407]|uniref:winged helix-turn-helix transcriptional regulator n=1 Tax=Streptomyces sp. NPDC001407 TaxID=3364573 RepID=UPI0036AB3D36